MKVYLYKANDKKHKYKIVFEDGKSLKFGSFKMSDFTKHKDEKRKDLYIKRHAGMGENWKDIKTKGFWSRWLLWEKENFNDAIKNIENKFNINIIKKF